jgi:hypothetical protein
MIMAYGMLWHGMARRLVFRIFSKGRCERALASSEQRPTAPTRHLGANKGYASKPIYFIIKNHTFLSITKCRVGAEAAR